MAYTCILLRHGQSQWNLENRFTGWVNVPLSPQGIAEAATAGKMLKEAGLIPKAAFTSYLQRAIKTLWLALEEAECMHIPVEKSWRLNEKHYGALQGLDKSETAAKYGEEQVLLWRRGYDVQSPALDAKDPQHPANQEMYRGIDPALLPATESLKDTLHRLLPFWEHHIVPSLKEHKTIVVAAHGNSLRAIVQHVKGLSNDEILKLNIPTGVPYVFELNEEGKYLRDRYLLDEQELEARLQEVANQGKARS